MASKSKFALGALLGATAGVVAGMLTAPKSGKETRADLKRKADEFKHEAATRGEQAKQSATKTADEVRGHADDLKDRTQRAADAAKKEFNKKP